jgi:membrane protein YqaA with SNARE-associated domain
VFVPSVPLSACLIPCAVCLVPGLYVPHHTGRRALQKRRADEAKMRADMLERERQHELELLERKEAARQVGGVSRVDAWLPPVPSEIVTWLAHPGPRLP